MAESYRGLTIRIGGDTTKLTQALKTANQAISGTASDLKRLSAAMKLDPSSLNAANLQMGAMASSASAAAMRLSTLNDAMRKVGEQTYGGESVAKLAENTKNAQMNAELARTSYAELTESLAKMNAKMSEYTAATAKAASSDFGAKMKESFREGAVGADDIAKALGSLPANVIRPAESATEQFASRMDELRTKFETLTAQAQTFKAKMDESTGSDRSKAETKFNAIQKQIDNLLATADKAIDKFAKFDGQVFNFENDNTSVAEIRRAFEAMPDSIRPSQAAINDFIAEVQRLKDAYDSASDELEKAVAVAQFKDLNSEIVKTNAQITNLSREMANMKLPSDLLRGMYEQTQAAKALGEAYLANMSAAKGMAEAYKTDPNNTDALTKAQELYAQAVLNATERVSEQQAILDKYEAERAEIEAFTDTSKSAQQQLNEMAVAHAHASEEVARLEGEEARLTEVMNKTKNAVDEVARALDEAGDDDLEHTIADGEEYESAEAAIEAIRTKLVAAREEEARFAKGEELAKKRKEWEEASTGVVEWTAKATDARVAGERLANTDVTPKYDDDMAGRLQKMADEIERVSAADMGMGDQLDDIKNFDMAVQEAVKRVKELDAELKKDPDNQDTKTARAQAIATATELATREMQKLNVAIEQMKSGNIDKVAISTGEVAYRLAAAKTAFNEAVATLGGYEGALKRVSDELTKLQSKPMSTRTDEDRQRIEQLIAEYERLKEAIKAAQTAADDAGQELVKAQSTQTFADATSQSERLKYTLEDLGRTAEETHQRDATPKVDSAAFMQSVNMIANAMKRLSGEIISSSNTIDSAYRDMRKTVNGTEDEFESLLNAAIKFSQTSITSADTMLEMQALGGQLGVLTEDLEQFGRITSSLDIATDMDADDIALRLGQVANVLSLDIDGMQGFSDALVRLGNNMPAQESAIMNVAQRLSAVASTANFSGAEILAWSAAIASTGQRSEAAATAIGNTISGIESAVAEGGDDIQAFATVAGRSSEDFVRAWKESPTDALRAFLEGLQNINSQGESAVAALENMGITGVRQQQTLLGLSKTVGSLDKALEISEDAWNGVTDQWGQAGDAANEAEKKSAGFSGALAIMQNNASNLAASLGDGFIPAMKIASDVMRIITDVLNEMPAPMKTAIVSIGGIATVLGTVVPVVGQFSKGWAAAAQAAVDSGGSLGGLVAKLTGLEASMVSAGEAAGTLSIGMTALGTVGIAAFVTALTFAVSSIADAIEKQQELEAATTGLESAMSNSSVAYEAYSTGAEGAATSTRDLISETDELISKQAELAQQMTDMWGEIGTKEAVLDSYVQRILQLSDQLTLTKEEQAELNAAVEAFNDTTGSNLEIVNEVTGSLSKSSEEIENIASAWRKTTESNGAMEQYLATTKQLAEDTAELERIEAQLGNTSSNATGWFVDMRNSAGSLDGEYMNLASKADMLRSSIESASAAQQQAISMMSASEVSVAELKAAIEASGYSLSAYASVTAAQWSHIASVYGTNVTKAIEELNRLAKAQGTALSSSTAYTPSITSSSGGSNSAAKKALQRENDAAYKAQQKAYDAEYKALQKALNKKYNAEKKNLDAIYKERKKQYDAQLKQLKDAQDDEVEAFNKATDAKLKEMEREYKARVKALEEQYGLNDIDEQIEALEAETEAEKRALEERKQQEKVAELKAAVDKAKSRRKRAEAEKKLNDYLEEIGVKHNEQTRKDQIEALKKQKEDLKDELAARKEELKAQYDAEVEAYKDARAQELDALKEANQAEYDAQKEKYDNLLAQLKERQTEQLEALKESQTAQLEALKDSQQAALQAMKDAQQDAVDALSEGTGEVGAVLENAEEDALRKLEEALAKAREEMDAKIPDIKDKFRELVGNVAEETSKIPVNMQQHAQEGTKNLQDVLGNSIQPTRGKADELRAALDNGLSPIPGNFDTYGRNATTNLRNQVDGSVGPTGRSAQQLADAVNMPIDQLQNMIPPEVLSAMGALSDGISHGGRMAEYNADNVASNINGSFSGLGGGQSYMWGYDFLSNFNSGLVSVWNNNLFPNIQTIANTITAWLGHSVPDKGPLQNDDEWGADFVMNLVNGMHDKESDLYKQVKKMAEIVEDGFDPELSLDAAYEAVGGIRGKANRQVQPVAGAGTTINMTMNLDLSNVSFRSEQDIDRFADEVSKRMAAAAARQMAGRL